MSWRIQLYAALRRAWVVAGICLLPPLRAYAQDVPWTTPVHSLLTRFTNVIVPAVGIAILFAGAAPFVRAHASAIFRVGLCVLVGSCLLLPLRVYAQDVPWTTPIQTLLTNFTDVIAPAIGIGGLIAAGASFVMGHTGAIFKVGLGVVIGSVIMAHAQDIWQTFFGGHGGGGVGGH